MTFSGARAMEERVTWWAPTFKGDDEPNRSMAVPWRWEQLPTKEDYKAALIDRMDHLIKADRKEARWAMDLEEHFEQIRMMEPIDYWAFHIGLSPHMNFMLAAVDWDAQCATFEFDEEEDIPALSDYIEGLGVR
jgi:hypothetical protein